jgi:hypothetical protein
MKGFQTMTKQLEQKIVAMLIARWPEMEAAKKEFYRGH